MLHQSKVRLCINITGCTRIAAYWSETTFVISLKENIIFVKLFEASFGSNILASFSEFHCQDTDTFGFIRVRTFQIHIQGNFLHKQYMDTCKKCKKNIYTIFHDLL